MCLSWRINVPCRDTRSLLFNPDFQYKPTTTGGTHHIRNPWFLLSHSPQDAVNSQPSKWLNLVTYACLVTHATKYVCAFSECNCHGKAEECHFNQTVADLSLSLDIHGQRRGGGVCVGCRDYTAGINCETCIPGFYTPAGVEIILCLVLCPRLLQTACNTLFTWPGERWWRKPLHPMLMWLAWFCQPVVCPELKPGNT